MGLEISEHLGMQKSESRCASELLSGLFCAATKNVARYFRGVGIVVPRESRKSIGSPAGRFRKPITLPSRGRRISVIPRTFRCATCSQRRRLRRRLLAGHHGTSSSSSVCVLPGMWTGGIRTVSRMRIDSISLMPPTPCRNAPRSPLTWTRPAACAPLPWKVPPLPRRRDLLGQAPPAHAYEFGPVAGRSLATDVCFRRSNRHGDANKAFMDCVEGGGCEVNRKSPGLRKAEDCPPGSHVVGVPQQGEAAWTGETNGHWKVASFAALQDMSAAERPGYTEFHVVSEREDANPDATHFTVGVMVNGVPLHMDGKPPFLDRHSLGQGSRVHVTFAVENLGFNGGPAGDGQEQIDLELRFFDGNLPLKTVRLLRRYVAYRHARSQLTADGAVSGEAFEWSGYYRPAHEASFEVMLEHGTTADWMKFRRAELDGRGLTVLGHPLHRRHPPWTARELTHRHDRRSAVAHRAGEIPFLTFRGKCHLPLAADTAGSRRYPSGAILHLRVSRETFSDLHDRGRQVADCRDI